MFYILKSNIMFDINLWIWKVLTGQGSGLNKVTFIGVRTANAPKVTMGNIGDRTDDGQIDWTDDGQIDWTDDGQTVLF